MADAPRPKSHNDPLLTLDAFQRAGEVIKPVELIDIYGGQELNLLARRVYNQLLAHAFGPDMAAEGREFKITLSELRGNHTSNDRVRDAVVQLMRTVVRVRMSDGKETLVQLLGETDIETQAGVTGWLTYTFQPRLLPILRDSRIFARLELQLLHGFRTKYGMALYEIVARRVGQKHVFYEDIDTDGLRDLLGVPEGKLGPFGALRRKAIEPAVEEVNAVAPFSCSIEPVETKGRKVVALRLSWWNKSVEEQKDQWANRPSPIAAEDLSDS